MRHTAGTLALRTGSDLRQVQDLLGHADPKTTSIYAHVGDRWENNPGTNIEREVNYDRDPGIDLDVQMRY